MFCGKCGNVIEGNFCVHCGQAAGATPAVDLSSAETTATLPSPVVLEIKAYKNWARFMYREIITKVEIAGQAVTTTANFGGKIIKNKPEVHSFLLRDIEQVSTGFSPIIYFSDLVRFALAAIIIPVDILYALLVYAVFFIIAVERTVKIKLKSGQVIKVYYEKPGMAEELIAALQQ